MTRLEIWKSQSPFAPYIYIYIEREREREREISEIRISVDRSSGDLTVHC